MPSIGDLYSLHLRPLGLFCKNCSTLLGWALLERDGTAHSGRTAFRSVGFDLQKCSTVSSGATFGFAHQWSVGFVRQKLSLTFSPGTITDTGAEDRAAEIGFALQKSCAIPSPASGADVGTTSCDTGSDIGFVLQKFPTASCVTGTAGKDLITRPSIGSVLQNSRMTR